MTVDATGRDVWTGRQRKVLWGFVLALAAVLAVRMALRRQTIPDPPPDDPPLQSMLETRIDPNVADEAELSALPVIGPKRARQIIDYRQQRLTTRPHTPVFTCPEDLDAIKGLGPATIDTLRPYLTFPRGGP